LVSQHVLRTTAKSWHQRMSQASDANEVERMAVDANAYTCTEAAAFEIEVFALWSRCLGMELKMKFHGVGATNLVVIS